MNWYLTVLRNYANFSGRARRKEFWMFVLINFLFTVAAAILDVILGTTFDAIWYGYIYLLYSLAMFIPGLAVTVRRLHDIGKSGWFYFVALIPIIGAIWLLVLLCRAGDIGPNKYGEDPKQMDSFKTNYA